MKFADAEVDWKVFQEVVLQCTERLCGADSKGFKDEKCVMLQQGSEKTVTLLFDRGVKLDASMRRPYEYIKVSMKVVRKS